MSLLFRVVLIGGQEGAQHAAPDHREEEILFPDTDVREKHFVDAFEDTRDFGIRDVRFLEQDQGGGGGTILAIVHIHGPDVLGLVACEDVAFGMRGPEGANKLHVHGEFLSQDGLDDCIGDDEENHTATAAAP